MKRVAVALLLACGGACGGATAPNDPGKPPDPPTVGPTGYVDYAPGELPIILSAPHGGEQTPSSIPDRTASRCATDDDFSATNDLNTIALAQLVADSLRAQTGKRAHLVVSHLARRKLDANRDSLAASCGDATAGRAWHEYHTLLDSARAVVARTSARGLYVDLHGHAHAIARIELGYLLRGADLDRADVAVEALEQSSSIRALSQSSPLSFAALLRGPTSLGALLAREGYAAVPSPDIPGPNGAPYFTGGYDTERHGCRTGGVVCGVQAELPFDGVRDTEASRARFAGKLARVLTEYVATHGQ